MSPPREYKTPQAFKVAAAFIHTGNNLGPALVRRSVRSVRWCWASANIGCGPVSLDRVAIAEEGDALLIVLADGAGGMARGGAASDAVLAARRSWSARDALASDGRAAVAWLHELDHSIARAGHGGQCTAVVGVVEGDRIVGASIGDSIAWICGDGITDLTEAQHRKPLVGSGEAVAVGFVGSRGTGRLLVASDGLWKYADRDRINAVAMAGDVASAATRLVDLVRLPSGGLQDDVSLALVDCTA